MAGNLLVGLAIFAVMGVVFYLFLSGLFWGAGWYPTPRKRLEAAASLLELKDGDTVFDLGSGFGKALIFFAKTYNVSATGIEIDPLRCFVTKWNATRQGASAKITVLRGNLMDADLGQTSKVFFFLSPLLMKKLQEKVAREMPDGARVVSVDHRFPDWKPAASRENVHLYVVSRLPEV